MRKIAIIGGIGSGKSVVSKVLRIMGYPVYDCDSEAKRLMDNSAKIHEELVKAFGEKVVVSGNIDRKYLASLVFNDKSLLNTLNGIVHPAVKVDFEAWAISRKSDVVFVETAILFESKMDDAVDEIWVVDAPIEERIKRVMARDNCDRPAVEARILMQTIIPPTTTKPITHIANDNTNSILKQITELLKVSVGKVL